MKEVLIQFNLIDFQFFSNVAQIGSKTSTDFGYNTITSIWRADGSDCQLISRDFVEQAFVVAKYHMSIK